MKTSRPRLGSILVSLVLAGAALQARADARENWNGFYAGANAGYGWAHISGRQTALDENIGSTTVHGAAFGLQAGFDHQTSDWVWGLHLALDEADLTGCHLYFRGSGPLNRVTYRIKSLATLTGRVGYAVEPNLLAYVKAGAVRTRTDHVDADPVPSSMSTPYSGHKAVTRRGWLVGGGLERRIGRRASMYVEYSYLAFGRRAFAIPYSDGMVVEHSFKQDMSLFSGGVNYRFR